MVEMEEHTERERKTRLARVPGKGERHVRDPAKISNINFKRKKNSRLLTKNRSKEAKENE